MMRSALVALAVTLPLAPTAAQIIQGNDGIIRIGPSRADDVRRGTRRDITRETRTEVSIAPAAVLRGLDKMSGESVDVGLGVGTEARLGYLSIFLHECRFPRDNPTGNAFAHLTIKSDKSDEPVFDGWMIASSPALVALDHPRFDVWVIRCKHDDRTPSVVAGESSPRPLMRP